MSKFAPTFRFAAVVAIGCMVNGLAQGQAANPSPDSPASTGDPAALSRQIEAFNNVRHVALFEDRDPAVRADFEAMQWALIERAPLHENQYHAQAFRNLFALARTEASPDPEALSRIVNGLARHVSDDPVLAFARAPLLLAEQTGAFEEAEAIVSRGLDSVLVQVERDSAWYADEEERLAVRAEQLGILTDALGWIRHLADSPDSAQAALVRSHALWPENQENLYHLGRFYEARAQDGDSSALVTAERFYRLGAVAPGPGPNPNRPALEELYLRTRGSLQGWEAYENEFEQADQEWRRMNVLSNREAHPESLPPFELENLSGSRFSSIMLRDRVAVINFWGVWCSWCLKEMPDFQRLHDRYATVEDVAIISINNDDDWDVARTWMEEQGYDFTVLRDDGYVMRDAGVTGFPTTWFVDRAGRIAFQKRGWTEKLLEEFSWRIESLRQRETDSP